MLNVKSIKEGTPVWSFYKEAYGIDISNIQVRVEAQEGNSLGHYQPSEQGQISITTDTLSPLRLDMVLVHEINHLIQFEYGHTLSLNFNSISDIAALEFFEDRNNVCYEERSLEIDSRIAEVYFLYGILEQDGFNGVIPYLTVNTSIHKVKCMIKRMIDEDFKNIVLPELEKLELKGLDSDGDVA